jgi:hypothetical protein
LMETVCFFVSTSVRLCVVIFFKMFMVLFFFSR